MCCTEANVEYLRYFRLRQAPHRLRHPETFFPHKYFQVVDTRVAQLKWLHSTAFSPSMNRNLALRRGPVTVSRDSNFAFLSVDILTS
jgi:hypothetical protein